MPVACHPNRRWDWCVSEDVKKEIDPMFIEELEKCALVVYKWGVLKHFVSYRIETFIKISNHNFMINILNILIKN